MCRRATKPGVDKAARKEVLPILFIAVRQRTDVPEVRCPNVTPTKWGDALIVADQPVI